MVIQCTHCQTRFSIADRLMKPDGIKIRCAKCKEVFMAQPSAETEVPQPLSEIESPPVSPPAPGEVSDEFFFDAPVAEAESSEPEGGEANPFFADASAVSFDDDPFGSIDLEPDADLTEQTPAPTQEDAATDAGEEMDQLFKSLAESSVASSSEIGVEDSAEIPDLPFERDLDDYSDAEEFSFEEETLESIPLVKPSEDPVSEESSYDFDEDLSFEEGEDELTEDVDFSFEEAEDPFSSDYSFDDSEDEATPPSSGVEEFSFDEAETDEKADEPLPFSEVNIGVQGGGSAPETEEIGLNFKDPRPAVEPESFDLPAPVTPTVSGRSASHARVTGSPVGKKKNRGARPMLALCVLLLALIFAGGVFYFQKGPAGMQAVLDQLLGTQAPKVHDGSIAIGDLSGFYIVNVQAGELFVVSGNATNRYPHARANVQLKGLLYSSEGALLLQQTIFAGNPMDKRTLRSLPLGKIQENMNNQFGDSLSNFNLQPGRSIPFTVVFHDLPDTLSEFTVEVVDSRPAAVE